MSSPCVHDERQLKTLDRSIQAAQELSPEGLGVRGIDLGIGVPCGIGIGATKTLAKLANHVAKSADRNAGSHPAELGCAT